MNIDFERLYDGVELIVGMGSPARRRLCVMSFAAFLAGDRHTDEPRCASPVIRMFTIPINDGMDHATRQRLKPFAPRIIGTADGLDRERADLLRKAMFEEVAPLALDKQIIEMIQADRVSGLTLEAECRRTGANQSVVLGLLRVRRKHAIGDYRSVAEAAATVLVALAQTPNKKVSRRFWNKAIDLLDRLCDVGAEKREPAAINPIRARHILEAAA